MEETLGQRRGTEDAATDGACTLAKDGDIRGVATEVGNVALYPLESEDLVEDAIVATMALRILLCQCGMGHEAKGSSAIFDTDNHHTTQGEVTPQVATIPLRLETTTMDPYHDGQFLAGRGSWGGNAQIKAILTHHIGRTTRTCGLWGHRSEFVAQSHAFPSLGRLRGAPTQIAHWGSGIGNSLIDGQRTVDHTFHIARLHVRFQQWLTLHI